MKREALLERIERWKTCPYKFDPDYVNPHPALPIEYVDVRDHLEYFRSVARGLVLEIGTDVGHSTAAFLLGITEKGGKLCSVDNRVVPAFTTYADHPQWAYKHADSQRQRDEILAAFGISEVVTSLDVLYIDGDHSFQGCSTDLNNYGPLVKKGGQILIHDVLHPTFPGVAQAMKEYVGAHFDTYLSIRDGSWGLGIIHV